MDYRIEFRLLGTGIHTGGVIASVPSLNAERSLHRESGQYRQNTERSSPVQRRQRPSRAGARPCEDRGSIVITTAGNYGYNTGSPFINRLSVVPVASCDEPD